MTTITEHEIVALERAYWDAMKNEDVDSAIALTRDPCIVTGAQGAATFDHKQMSAMYDGKTWSLDDYEIDNIQAFGVGDDVAVLGYTVKLGMTVDGKPVSLECAESSTWVREDGKWLCVLHNECPLGDPFGRDRK